MKLNLLIAFTILFFIVVNTSYYWDEETGNWLLPIFLVLIIIYFGLIIALALQAKLSINERFTNKKRLFTLALLTAVTVLTYYYPTGLINFAAFEAKDLLVATREGAANCRTTLRLKEDYTFKEKTACFSMEKIEGRYYLQNDTIYFDTITSTTKKDAFYKFAIVEPSKSKMEQSDLSLKEYKNTEDTLGYELFVVKNELKQLQKK